MPNRREFDHIGGYNFKIELEGVDAGAFTEAIGPEVITEVLATSDGEEMTIRKRPGRTTCSNIILRRGFTNTEELWDWYKAVMDGRIERRSGSIVICDDVGDEIVRYNFLDAWPCRWKISPINAQQRSTLIEEIEIVAERIERR